MDSKTENWSDKLSECINKVRDYVIVIFTFVVYKVARSLVVSFQKISWGITGVEYVRRNARQGLQYKQSAHVLDIIWRRKFCEMEVADSGDFIAVHNCFKHPNYVLKQEVSLYCLTRHEAVFIETGSKVNIYDSEVHIAFHNAQFLHAQKVITMPLASFHKMSSELGDPRVPVIWISRTWRCGSAMLRQMFEGVPGMLTIGEPDALTSLGYLERDRLISNGEYTQLLASTIRLLCKPNNRSSMVCVKTRPCCFRMVEDIHKLLPGIGHIFMYRNSLKTVSSVMSTVLNTNPLFQAARFVTDSAPLSAALPCIRHTMYNLLGRMDREETTIGKLASNLSTVGIITSGWASSVTRCEKFQLRGVRLLPVLCEDIIKFPRRSCELVFERFRIPSEHVTAAVNAFRRDTRRTSSVLARMPVMSESRRDIEPEKRLEADSILKMFNLPKLGERYEISGILTTD